MLLGFDFDSVIVQTEFTLCGILTEFLGTQVIPEHINYYGLEHNFSSLTPDDVRHIIDKTCGMEETLQIPPIDGAFDFLKWYAKSNPIYIITNREDIEPVKVYCSHQMGYNTFSKTHFISSKDKGSICGDLGITHFVEDCPRNLINLANNGIVPLMFIRNWNVNLFTGRELITQLIRFIYNWEDVYSMIQCEQENII